MKRALLLIATMLATPAAAQTVAITGGTVAIGDGSAPIEGGTVVMPYDTPPWGGRFGMLTDRFGVDWMVALNAS